MTAEALPVVLVTGAPGTGKSTLGLLLARKLRAALLDLDVATEPLVDVVQQLIGVHDLNDGRLHDLTRTARYEVLAALAVDNLAAGVPVVLVAPYTTERAQDQAWATLRARLEAAGGAPLLVWLTLPPDEIRRRLQARGAARDRFLLGDGHRPPGAPRVSIAPVAPHLEIRADQPVEMLVAAVLTALVQPQQ